MRIVTCADNNQNFAGVVDQDHIMPIAAAYAKVGAPNPPSSVLALIEGGTSALHTLDEVLRVARSWGKSASPWRPLSGTPLLAPIPQPVKNVFCVGRNYKLHIEEAARTRGVEPTYPKFTEFFSKPRTTVVGHQADVRLDADLTKAFDYEVEMAIVIGKKGRDIKAADALSHIFGYTVFNDVTARDLQRAHGQWFKGKGLDTTGPLGPWIVTADEFGDPGKHRLTLRVNGETRQDSNTSDMLFNCAQIIESLSAGLTLDPGDIIATGTPSGVGFAMQPPKLLKDGDVMEAEVEGVGVLRNTVRAVRRQ